MAGIYEALLHADRERNPDTVQLLDSQHDETSAELAEVGALLQRLEDRSESEISTSVDDRFEHYASLEVSINALEDRLDAEERERDQSSADLEALVARLVTEVSDLSSRIDHEMPLLRAELVEAIQRIGLRRAARKPRRKSESAGLLSGIRRLVAGRPSPDSVQPS